MAHGRGKIMAKLIPLSKYFNVQTIQSYTFFLTMMVNNKLCANLKMLGELFQVKMDKKLFCFIPLSLFHLKT